MTTLEQKLEQMVFETIYWMGYTLWGVVYNPKPAVLRIYIDKTSGITVDDCAEVSRQLSAMLDVDDPIGAGYVLEVSSPGLDRPLLKPAHWQQCVGDKIRVTMLTPQNGKTKFTGILSGLANNVAELVITSGEAFMLPLNQVKKAHIVPKFEQPRNQRVNKRGT